MKISYNRKNVVMSTSADNIIKLTVTQPTLEIQGEEGERIPLNSARVTVSQPALEVQCAEGEEVRQTALIAFGRWFKGDKGDKGDSWDNDFGVATKEDIDRLFIDGETPDNT